MTLIKIIKKSLLRIFFVVLGFGVGMGLFALWLIAQYEPLYEATPYDFVEYIDKAEAWQENFAFLDLQTTQPITVGNMKEKVLFVNFWATWCGSCLAEMPSIEKLKNRFVGKPVRFIIATDEVAQKVKKFPIIKKWDLPFYTYNGDKIPMPLVSKAIPATFLIVNGEVVYSHVGMADWDSPEIVELLNRYLEKVK